MSHLLYLSLFKGTILAYQILCFIAALTLCFSAAPSYALSTHEADNLTQQWLEIERQSNALVTDWQTQKLLLKQRITLLEAEKNQLTQLITDNQKTQTSAQQERTLLLQQQNEMEQQQLQLEKQLEPLQRQLQVISQQLPPPLKKPWQAEAEGNSESDNETISAQLQVALAQLSKLADFNQRISVTEAPITNHNQQPIMVKQLFLGAGFAWFSNDNGEFSGIGYATPNGWIWHQDEHINSKEILNAIAIYEKRKEAGFVQLPVDLIGKEQGR